MLPILPIAALLSLVVLLGLNAGEAACIAMALTMIVNQPFGNSDGGILKGAGEGKRRIIFGYNGQWDASSVLGRLLAVGAAAAAAIAVWRYMQDSSFRTPVAVVAAYWAFSVTIAFSPFKQMPATKTTTTTTTTTTKKTTRAEPGGP